MARHRIHPGTGIQTDTKSAAKGVEAIVQDDAFMERVQRELIDFTAGTTPRDGCLAMTWESELCISHVIGIFPM